MFYVLLILFGLAVFGWFMTWLMSRNDMSGDGGIAAMFLFAAPGSLCFVGACGLSFAMIVGLPFRHQIASIPLAILFVILVVGILAHREAK